MLAQDEIALLESYCKACDPVVLEQAECLIDGLKRHRESRGQDQRAFGLSGGVEILYRIGQLVKQKELERSQREGRRKPSGPTHDEIAYMKWFRLRHLPAKSPKHKRPDRHYDVPHFHEAPARRGHGSR